jgi:hypothetical protein
MVERRNLMGGGLAAGLAALVAGDEAEAAPQRDAGDSLQVSREIDELRQSIEALSRGPWARVYQIRAQQQIWLRANHKYPDFIEIGFNVWDGLYDWHVRYQQPINVTRSADGRYLMAFTFTTLVLRPDQDPDYVGPPFDGDRRPVQ